MHLTCVGGEIAQSCGKKGSMDTAAKQVSKPETFLLNIGMMMNEAAESYVEFCSFVVGRVCFLTDGVLTLKDAQSIVRLLLFIKKSLL